MKNVQKTFVMESGERYCMLVDVFGLPLYYASLYVTTQVRNNSLSFSAMESTLNAISVLHGFLDERGENLEQRFREGKFFEESELDAIRDYCQIKFRSRTTQTKSNALFTLEELQ